jgi:CubicO group peptidase (beta-lactamase class C family)
VQSVSGGGHFGGGLFVSTADLARFGLLIERDGRWGRASVVGTDWIAAMVTPSRPNPEYGLLWWLNTDRKAIPAAPASSFWAAGFGGNYVYVDREHDLVVVLRWVPEFRDVIGAIVGSIAR